MGNLILEGRVRDGKGKEGGGKGREGEEMEKLEKIRKTYCPEATVGISNPLVE